MKVLVTAFGPFGGRARNASMLALAGLKQRLPWLHTRILPVDAVLAPLRVNRALREVGPHAILMLGEAGGSTSIRLETTAWNELDFRIPDGAGRQPRGEPIDINAPDSLVSTLPFDEIHTRLAVSTHRVSFSNDAGRYLCNQVLFHALWRIRRKGLGAKAGFVHLPLETELPTLRAVEMLAAMVDVIQQDSAEKNENFPK